MNTDYNGAEQSVGPNWIPLVENPSQLLASQCSIILAMRRS